MNAHQLNLAADLLKDHSDRLSCDTCSEVFLEDTPENREVERLVGLLGDPDDFEPDPPGEIKSDNWCIALALSLELRKHAESL